MHWFLDPIKNHYFDFEGRVTRQAFWMFILSYVLCYIVVAIVAGLIGIEALLLLFSLAVLIPGLAITARRLHDTGLSGWWQLLGLIPVLGLIIMIVLLVRQGETGSNQYGADPRGGDIAPAATTPEAADATEPAAPPEPENTKQGYGSN